MPHPLHITVWNEFIHEKTKPEVARHYPAGLHRTIADALIRQLGERASVRTATPDERVLVSWFAGGEVFRSGCTFRRGKEKIVYFSPGHETFPIYHDPNVQRILANAARWSAPTGSTYHGDGRHIPEPLEALGK